MKIAIWKSLARGVILESVRRKDLWVVAILGLIIMLCSGALGFFGMSGLGSFAKDLASTVLSLFSAILAIVTTTRIMPDEIKNRTLYPLLSRPISRFDLLMGKWLGAVAISWIAFGILSLMVAGSLVIFGVQFEPVMAQYLLLKMFGLAVLCAVSLTLSLFMTPSAATTLSAILAFGTSMIVRALVMASTAAGSGLKTLFAVLNGILPQYGLFDLGGRAANTNWGLAPMWVVGVLFAYAAVYSGAMLTLSWLKFRHQAV